MNMLCCTTLALSALLMATGCKREATATAGVVDVAGIRRAQDYLSQFRTEPKFNAPGDPFNIRDCAKNKTMLSIPISSANPFVQGIIERETAIGSKIGLRVVGWQNSGLPGEWAQGVNHAVHAGFDIVDLISGIDPNIIEPQIKEAEQSGVKVMTSHFYDPLQTQNPNLTGSLTVSFNTAGRLLADWAILQENGAAHVLIVKSDVPPTLPFVDGIRQELTTNCSGCVIVQEINVTASDWSTKIQPSVQSALLSHTDINVIIPLYDSMSQFVIPAVGLAGLKDSVSIGTFNGTPFVLDSIARGDVAMDIGESLDWIAYATLDGYLRKTCGLKSPSALNVPFYIFDRSNVAQAGVPASYDKGYGNAYLAGFRSLWNGD